MIMVSARKGFWDNNTLSDSTDDIRDVNLDTLTDKPVKRSEFKDRISGKKVLLLIHGYNNESNEVARAYKIIQQQQSDYVKHYDLLVGYTWPGGDDFLDYFAAKHRAGSVSQRTKKLLEFMLKHGSELGIMSHSMGCRIALLTLDDLQRARFQKNIPLVSYLMAAAVDNESIEQHERYFEGSIFADKTLVFHSRHDGVLGKAYRLSEWDRALGQSGPENPGGIAHTVRVINCKGVVRAHGAYKRTPEVYDFIKQELKNQPTRQFVSL